MRIQELHENKWREFADKLKRLIAGDEKAFDKGDIKKYSFPMRGLSGTRGEDVKGLQTALNGLGFNAGAEDGIYGNKTTMAVRQFQRTYGLRVDGDAGPEVAKTLNGIVAGTVEKAKPKAVGKKRGRINIGPDADVKTIITGMARKYGINKDVVMAVAKVESNFEIDAVGDTDLSQPAYGVMQIRLPAFLDARQHTSLRWDWEEVKTEPKANIEAGIAYLAVGRDVYGYTDYNDLVRFYNGGPNGPKRNSTRDYHAKVVRAYKSLV